MKDADKEIAALITSIRDLQPICLAISEGLKQKIQLDDGRFGEDDSKLPGSHWRLVLLCDASTRVRILAERNFAVIETLGLLSTTRYLFELSVWVKLIQRDETFGLLYYRMWLRNQLERNEALLRQARREVELLKRLGESEADQIKKVLTQREQAEIISVNDVSATFREISDSIDVEAANMFSIYANAAKINGYSFQAHLVEKKVIPGVIDDIEDIKLWQKALDEVAGAKIAPIQPSGPWKWKAMAEKVGMGDEYDFIYDYSSRMLHATPASLTTDQPALEPMEVFIFIRYCTVKMKDIIGAAQQQLNSSTFH